MNGETISPLRRRMIEDMKMRKLVAATQRDYIRHVKALASSAPAWSEDRLGLRAHFRIGLPMPVAGRAIESTGRGAAAGGAMVSVGSGRATGGRTGPGMMGGLGIPAGS